MVSCVGHAFQTYHVITSNKSCPATDKITSQLFLSHEAQ